MKQHHCYTLGLLCLLMVLMVPALAGCSFHGGRTVANYVNTVKEDTKSAVNLTRELHKLHEVIDCRSTDDAKLYIEKLDSLSELYQELSVLEAPDRYVDLDSGIKKQTAVTLSCISQLKALATTATTTGDDSTFKESMPGLVEKYQKAYQELVSLSSQVTTRFRND